MRLLRFTTYFIIALMVSGLSGLVVPAIDNPKVAEAQAGPILTLTPEQNVRLQVGQTFDFMALWDTNGSEPGEVYDVSYQADWSVSNSSSVNYLYGGRIETVNQGDSEVTVSFMGQSVSVSVQVGGIGPQMDPDCRVGNNNRGEYASFVAYQTGNNIGVWGWDFNPAIENSGGNGVFDISPDSNNHVITTAVPQTSQNGPNGKPSNEWWFNVSPSVTYGAKLLSVGVTIQSDTFNGYLQCNDISVLYAAPEFSAGPTFECNVVENSFTVDPGQAHDFVITITPMGGFTGPVTFDVSSITPSPVNAPTVTSFTPNPTSTNTSTARVSTSAQTPNDSYSIMFRATSGSISDTCGTLLIVNPATGNFELQVTPGPEGIGIPPSQVTPNRILIGQTKTFTVVAVCTGGFTGPITNLEAVAQFSGVTMSFSPAGSPPNGATVNCGSSISLIVNNSSSVTEQELSGPSDPPGIILKDIIVRGRGQIN